jgi:murein DD-endopeptidase MepM/ murein hydrolase activator NlpD
MSSTEKITFLDKLKFRYRVVVINDESFKERVSFTLSFMNLIVFIGSVSLFMIFLLTYIIAFTSLREYIPGYADVNLRKNITKVALRSDSLLQASAEKDLFIANLNNIITGKASEQDLKKIVNEKTVFIDTSKLQASTSEKNFRKEILTINNTSSKNKSDKVSAIALLSLNSPIQGIVSNKFKATQNHFGIDISAQPNKVIQSALKGTVIFAGFTVENGYVIEVQHEKDLISVYKSNSKLLKKIGDKVNASDAIAIIGNNNERISGPHLHFELWYKGSAVDPQDYIKF